MSSLFPHLQHQPLILPPKVHQISLKKTTNRHLVHFFVMSLDIQLVNGVCGTANNCKQAVGQPVPANFMSDLLLLAI